MNTNLGINTIKIRGYKNKFLAISLIAIFAISIAMTFAPSVSAQNGIAQPRQNVGYISPAPATVGVGQQLTMNLWINPLPQDYALAPAFNGFTGVSVTFTKPDGTKDTFMPTDGTATLPAGVTEALGTIFFYYTPNEAGNWSVQFTMPAQNYTDSKGTVQWTGCTSQPAYFTVTTEQQNAGLLNGYPFQQLPNSNTYWTYPINSNNREWFAISGDWLNGPMLLGTAMQPIYTAGAGGYQPFGTGPTTDHINWNYQQALGGLVGGYLDSTSYSGTSVANSATGPAPVIIAGNIYFNLAGGTQWICMSLATGKVLFTASGQITFGIHLPGNTFVQGIQLATSYGAYPQSYLVYNPSGSSSWIFYDPMTGATVRTITGVPVPVAGSQPTNLLPYPIAGSLTAKFSETSPIVYGYFQSGYNGTALQFAQSYVYEWNLTKVTGNVWNTGLVWNVSVNSPGHPNIGDGPGRSGIYISPDLKTVVLCEAAGGENRLEGYNAATGQSIWNITTPYVNEAVYELDSTASPSGTIINWDPTYDSYYAYDMATGALLWKQSPGNSPWSTFSSYLISNANYIYIGSFSGNVYCLDAATGNVIWTSDPITDTTGEYIQGVLPMARSMVCDNGILYVYFGYSLSYETEPISRFNEMVAFNATTGQIIWILPGGVLPQAVADGYLIGHGQNDGNLYVFGKGQTSTSVSTGSTVISEGNTVQIQGNVLDQSPAQPGTPAVSDASISEQMDYLHMQNATLLNNPPQEQGVLVALTVVDPNNNTVTIGTTTTDSAGNYYYSYVPSTTGLYKITASFAGSNSYWPSASETGLTVTKAAASSTSAPAASTSSGISATTLYTGIAAVIVVIIIVGVAIILMQQRKRP